MKRIAVAFLFAIALLRPASAGPFEDGLDAYGRGDYPAAFAIWSGAAGQGDPFAQLWVGVMLRNARGTEQDFVAAVQWWERAAVQVDSWADFYAQHWLGLAFANGEGVPQNYVLAYMWFSLAAGGGSTAAARERDLMSELLTPQQVAEAIRLAREWTAAHPG